ncbi:hypothetical protein J6590_009903 [Homalodisca vitripennis]|nr:hypothetical protein J6590_009903 [Homalodisca vitripennis]
MYRAARYQDMLGGFAREQHRKGGVIAYVKQELEDQLALVRTSDQTSELINKMSVYRPPISNLDDAIDILTAELDKALTSNQAISIMGDINGDNRRNAEQKRN